MKQSAPNQSLAHRTFFPAPLNLYKQQTLHRNFLMNVIVYYRTRPSEPSYSDIALQEQRKTVKNWVADRQASVQAEYVELETDGFSRPQLRKATDMCKPTGAMLVIARTESIGRGATFSPRISSIPVACVPNSLRECGHIDLAPEEAPPSLTLYFPDFRNLRTLPVYLCNGTDAPIYGITIRTIGITSKFSMPDKVASNGKSIAAEQPISTTPTTFSFDRLDARHAAVIDRYDPMFDSDFVTAFEITFIDQHEQNQLMKAFIDSAPLSSLFVALKT